MVKDEKIMDYNETTLNTTTTTTTTTTTNSTTAGSFLQSLPSTGTFLKYNVKKPASSQTIPKYIPSHNTNPPNDEFVKNEENNILIRNLINNPVNKRINEQSNKNKQKNDNGSDNVGFNSELDDQSPNKKARSQQ